MDPSVVETCSGPVRGYPDGPGGGIVAWKGIPYARAPVGELRFRSPRPPLPWREVRDCAGFGPICPQPAGMPMESTLVQDEACLNLNVWAPRDAREPRPVMVWLHGGAYFLGAGSQGVYSGRALAFEGGVVVVTVNYRLGPLGFVDLSGHAADGDRFAANVGLRDQIGALEWVRDNIAAFGGDPSSVTVFGESSGAGCVTTLMTVPAAAGLFHRAIAQSSPATSVYGRERAARAAEGLLRITRSDGPRGLRDLPAARLAEAGGALASDRFETDTGALAIAPVVDGDLVPQHPVDAFRTGSAHPVPLLIGTNRSEASIFRALHLELMPVSPAAVHRMFAGILREHAGATPERIAAVMAGYPRLWSAGGAAAVAQDAAFRMPAVWIAGTHSRAAPTWLYRFDHASPLLRATGIGAGHATELPYVFGTFGSIRPDPTFWLGGRAEAYAVARRLRGRWLGFAWGGVPDAAQVPPGAGVAPGLRGGSPSCACAGEAVDWPRYRVPGRRTLTIGARDEVRIDLDAAARRVWGPEPVGFR